MLLIFTAKFITMRQYLICFFLLVSSFSVLQAQDMSLFEKKVFISKAGDTLRYRILYPEQYDHARTYPMVMVLHGSGERGNDNELQLTHGAKLFLADSNRKNFPAIVVFPQCAENVAWGSVDIDRNIEPLSFSFNYKMPQTAPMRAFLALTRSLIKNERVNSQRVYITGLSMGGMGTFEAVYQAPGLFAAALPICGGGDAASYNKKTAKVPFWIFHGAADPVVNPQLSKNMVAKLKELKAVVKYSEYPGVGHNSWDNAFAEPEFLGWMFAQAKK
jgi:predicted peptidase